MNKFIYVIFFLFSFLIDGIGQSTNLPTSYNIEPYCYNGKQLFRIYKFVGTTITYRYIDSMNFTITPLTPPIYGSCSNKVYSDTNLIKRLDTIITRLTDTTKDTIKSLVFATKTKRIDGTQDTLYNCKGLSFDVKSGATGNITFYYSDGSQDVFDVATDNLPNWSNGEFVDMIGFDATGITGIIRINQLGCSESADYICAKEKVIFDCSNTTPILKGWQTNGVFWQTGGSIWYTK